MEPKTFNLATVLTITTGRFVCEDFGLVYEILNHMTQDDLYTHVLPRAADECVPYLFEQHPQLRAVTVPDDCEGFEEDDWKAWVEEMGDVVGATEFEVWPIHAEDHEVKDPIQELIDMGVDENKIVSINTEPPISDVGNIS